MSYISMFKCYKNKHQVSKYRFSITRNPLITLPLFLMSKFKMDSKMPAFILLHDISITMCDKIINKMPQYRYSITMSSIKTVPYLKGQISND